MNVDHDLRSALRVEPSPAFLAGVRARIAREPAPASRLRPMTLLAAAGTALAVVIAVSVSHDVRSGDTLAVQAALPVPATRAAPVVAARVPAAVPHAARQAAPGARAPRSHRGPLVIVPATAAEGLAELVAAVRDGRVDLAPLPADGTFVPVEPARGETIVAPMSVQTIAAITNSEGVRW